MCSRSGRRRLRLSARKAALNPIGYREPHCFQRPVSGDERTAAKSGFVLRRCCTTSRRRGKDPPGSYGLLLSGRAQAAVRVPLSRRRGSLAARSVGHGDPAGQLPERLISPRLKPGALRRFSGKTRASFGIGVAVGCNNGDCQEDWLYWGHAATVSASVGARSGAAPRGDHGGASVAQVTERENRELGRANEILRKASAYFVRRSLTPAGRDDGVPRRASREFGVESISAQLPVAPAATTPRCR